MADCPDKLPNDADVSYWHGISAMPEFHMTDAEIAERCSDAWRMQEAARIVQLKWVLTRANASNTKH